MRELREILQQFKNLFQRRKDFDELKEDFQEFLEDLKEEAAITPVEEELFLQVLSLKDFELGDFLIPRTDLVWLRGEQTWEEVKKTISQFPHHYYPVCRETMENFIGYVSLKDLASGILISDFSWLTYLRGAITLPRSIPITNALDKMRALQTQVVFIIDEQSEFIGMVTLKDIFEETFYFTREYLNPDEEGAYVIPGKTKIKMLQRCLNLKFSEGDYQTISGLVMELYKGVPPNGTRLTLDNLDLEIVDSDEKRIKLVKIIPKA